MGGFYNLSRSNTAFNTAQDFLTIVGVAGRTFRLIEVSLGGMATASAANELTVARSTNGTGAGGAVTAVPLQVNQSASGFTNATTWTTQPTQGNIILRIPCNANGGLYRWVRPPGVDHVFLTTDQASYRPAVGSSNMSFHTIVEEY